MFILFRSFAYPSVGGSDPSLVYNILQTKFCGQKSQPYKFYVQNFCPQNSQPYKFYVQNFVDKIVCRQIIQIFKASCSKSVADSYIFYSHKVFSIQMCLGLCSLCPSKRCVKFFELYCATLSKCSSKLQTFNKLRETFSSISKKMTKKMMKNSLFVAIIIDLQIYNS